MDERKRLDTEALIVGYAMSRLDADYKARRGAGTWKAAFQEAAAVLDAPPSSFNHLRDEFDPYHSNPRKGWRKRPLRPDRERIMLELADVGDDALAELVHRILAGNHGDVSEAVEALVLPTRTPANVAERLLTGRRAEEFFLQNCREIVGFDREEIADMRNSAQGFDFGIVPRRELAIEVKGLRAEAGRLSFTDREWTEAGHRRRDYWLVIVGNLAADPVARLIHDPHSSLDATCVYERSIRATWQCSASVR
jgi:hypothetical protein